MNITFNIDIEDWKELQLNFLKNNNQYKKLSFTLRVLLPIILILLIFFLFRINLFNSMYLNIFLFISVVSSFIWFIYFPKLFYKRISSNFIQNLSTGDNSGILGLHKLEFIENGIIHTLPKSESRFNWDGITKLEESESHFFLYTSELSAIIIPKEKVRNNLKELTAILKSNIA